MVQAQLASSTLYGTFSTVLDTYHVNHVKCGCQLKILYKENLQMLSHM